MSDRLVCSQRIQTGVSSPVNFAPPCLLHIFQSLFVLCALFTHIATEQRIGKTKANRLLRTLHPHNLILTSLVDIDNSDSAFRSCS
jgi:hypothetical protein